MKNLILAASAAFAIGSTPAAAVVIDFEDQPDSSIVAGALVYPDATFTSSSGSFFINGAGIGKDICTFNFGCDATLTVAFTAPVSGLTFQTAGEDKVGTLYVQVLFGMAAPINLTFGYDGAFSTLDTHDLTAYSDIVGLVMSSDDGAGVVYDNFRFNAGARVPEPGTWALLIAGYGLVGSALRRRTAAMA